MDSQPSLSFDPAKLSTLNFASLFLPAEDYLTFLLNRPGVNCHKPYGMSGNFYLTFNLYGGGKLLGQMHGEHCDQDGHLEFDFQDFTRFIETPQNSLIVANFYHSKDVPIEIYFAHIHKKTGSYIAYPALPFAGDELYPTFHSQQLENTAFWPGILADDKSEMVVVVANPYKVSYFFQVSLYFHNQLRAQTEPTKVSPYSVRYLPLLEIFENHKDLIAESQGRCSICVAAQFKVCTYMMIRSKVNGVITTIDHMHNYQLI